MQCDVAIIGGGPAGSTLGTFLKQYDPALEVVILEREIFPRDHVGESQLPQLMEVLDEMRVWDKVEAAGFPVKVGGRYRWGNSEDIWPLDFVPAHLFEDTPRPGRFEGQRAQTAFQVDRSIYDKILLDHAKETGCRVFEGVKVQTIRKGGDRVLGFELAAANDAGKAALGDEKEVTARYYVDGSGNSGMMRRAMGVEIEAPTTLRNIAIWDYWQNAEWAEHIGVGGTRILVMSIGWGWLWFIPLSPTRTSLGLVTPASYLKQTGKKPEELYVEAIAAEPTIAALVKAGHRENILQTTRDWSFIAERLHGDNWFLAGDSAGFADPILSGGLTLAQSGARKVAYTILALDKGELDAEWLKQEYDRGQRAQIANHVHFADYWYSTNGHFTELKEFCAQIAHDAGVDLEPEAAFRWMGSGGFAGDSLGSAHAGQFRIGALKLHIQQMSGRMPRWEVETNNVFHLNLEGATRTFAAWYHDGITERVECFRRGNRVLPRFEKFGAMLGALEHETELPFVLERYLYEVKRMGGQGDFGYFFFGGLETLEAMVAEGWVKASFDPKVSQFRIALLDEGFVYGWLEKGQGLRTVVPYAGNRIDVPWDKYVEACEKRGVPVA